jgi:hypothetical protein
MAVQDTDVRGGRPRHRKPPQGGAIKRLRLPVINGRAMALLDDSPERRFLLRTTFAEEVVEWLGHERGIRNQLWKSYPPLVGSGRGGTRI